MEVRADTWSMEGWSGGKEGRLYVDVLEEGVAVSIYGYDKILDTPVGAVGYFTERTKDINMDAFFEFVGARRLSNVKGCVARGYDGEDLAYNVKTELERAGVEVEVDGEPHAKRISLRSDGLLNIIYFRQYKQTPCSETELIPLGDNNKNLASV